MTITTEEHWEVDGESLQTYAWNLRSWGGSRQGAPPLRGEDLLIPGRDGRVHVTKEVDSRTVDLQGWVVGADADGIAGDGDLFRANWRHLLRLLFNQGRQIDLTRRWREDGVLTAATARGELLDGTDPDMTGPRRATFSAGIFLADPWFRGAEVVRSVAAGTTIVEVAGDRAMTDVVVELVGPLTLPTLTMAGAGFRYPSVPAGSVVRVDAGEFTATETSGSTTTNVLGKVDGSGVQPWVRLVPGPNTVRLTSTGAGQVRLIYRPKWL